MATTNQEAKTIVHTLRDALFQFAIKSRKLALPMLQQFGCSSEEPVTVDDDELRALKSRLRRIRAALRDAERLSVADHSVQLWLSELGDLEYRAEDVLEELEYEWRRVAELEELKIDLLRASATSTGKRKREVALLFAAAPPRRLRRKIEDIWARYEWGGERERGQRWKADPQKPIKHLAGCFSTRNVSTAGFAKVAAQKFIVWCGCRLISPKSHSKADPNRYMMG